jgi:signal peptidase
MKAEMMPFMPLHDEIPDDIALIDELIAKIDRACGHIWFDHVQPEKTRQPARKTAWRAVSGIMFYSALALVVLAAFVFSGSPGTARDLFGFSHFTVVSPSMQSAIPVGSLIVTRRPASPSELQVGDIITYFDSARTETITHRIVEIDPVNWQFTTKGDNNPGNDPEPIPADLLVGRVVWHVRGVGQVMLFLQQRIMWVIIIFALFVTLSFTLQIMLRKEKEQDEKPAKSRIQTRSLQPGLG